MFFLLLFGLGWGCASAPAVKKSVPSLHEDGLHHLLEQSRNAKQEQGVPSTLPKKGYLLKPLAEDVYFFTNGIDCTLFVVLPDGVVLVDPLQGAGELLQKALHEVTELPVTVIIYSTGSPRHIGDASRFGSKPTVIAQQKIADRLKESNPTQAPLPHMSFSNDYMLKTESLTLELHHVGGEITGDTLVVISERKVMLLPDRAIPNWVPHLERGEGIERRVLVLQRLSQMEFTAYVPGHGDRPGAPADLQRTLKFYEDGYRAFRFATMRVFGETAWEGTRLTVPPATLKEKRAVLERECYRLLKMNWGGRLSGFREFAPHHCRAWVTRHLPAEPKPEAGSQAKTQAESLP
ncbi:hypothetical protein [Nitrospina watsonii]|uniref:Metallo-beta-lactamase domain-containing protein n=1 Tax=Nitrospina watsonii TaxID=1323948 RepID=A0ABM9HB51_9BACT|nr:hypothetical protein [Nitrospina watsonii]CAI2717365.1 conserved protein of unknown function [Nitrospina watsonii]